MLNLRVTALTDVLYLISSPQLITCTKENPFFFDDYNRLHGFTKQEAPFDDEDDQQGLSSTPPPPPMRQKMGDDGDGDDNSDIDGDSDGNVDDDGDDNDMESEPEPMLQSGDDEPFP
jgi:hypothetical protein